MEIESPASAPHRLFVVVLTAGAADAEPPVLSLGESSGSLQVRVGSAQVVFRRVSAP